MAMNLVKQYMREDIALIQKKKFLRKKKTMLLKNQLIKQNRQGFS